MKISHVFPFAVLLIVVYGGNTIAQELIDTTIDKTTPPPAVSQPQTAPTITPQTTSTVSPAVNTENPPPSPSPSAASTPVPAVAVPAAVPVETKSDTPISGVEHEKIQEHILILDQARNPEQLFQYLRDTYKARDYQAALLAMSFDKTRFTTDTLKKDTLAKWNYIVDRLEDVYPEDFPTRLNRTERLFRSANSFIRLEFVRGPYDCWQIGPNSIIDTERVYQDILNDRPIRGDWITTNLPKWMFKIVFGLSWFQWITLTGGFFIGLFIYTINKNILIFLAETFMRKIAQQAPMESRAVWMQIASLGTVYYWFTLFSNFVLSPQVYQYAYYLFMVYTIIMLLLIMLKVIDVLTEILRIHMGKKYSSANVDKLVVPLFSRSMKVVVFCLAAITLAQTLGWPLLGILSGMGIGGIAIAFAAKDTVANFFGSLTVLIDRPFEIGDWIVYGTVEGTVESVGLRSTRIRTFYNSVITIPNNNIATAVIDNMGRRRYRRYRTFLTMEYENGPLRIEAFCEGVKELILNNPFTRKDEFTVCINDLADSSVNVLLIVFFVCPSSATEYRERAKLLKNILLLAESMDACFAYPTQKLYMERDQSELYAELGDGDATELGKKYATKILFPEPPQNPQKKPEQK